MGGPSAGKKKLWRETRILEKLEWTRYLNIAVDEIRALPGAVQIGGSSLKRCPASCRAFFYPITASPLLRLKNRKPKSCSNYALKAAARQPVDVGTSFLS